MVKVGTAEYDVVLGREKVRAEVGAVSHEIESGMGASARKVESEFGRMAKTALKGFVAYRGAAFAKEAIGDAVSLAQQQQRANVEFGKGVEIVDAYASHAAKGAGLSEGAALKAASGFGVMFKAVGVTGEKSAEMSTTLVQLAADLSALHGTDQDQAFQAIQRGLGGMGRGLRQYGIFLTDANLKQEAQALGLYKGTGALSQAAKTQASYALIVKGGAAANGAFADSTGDLIGRQKVLDAEWANTQERIGTDLVPAMERLVGVGTHVLDVFEAMPGPVQAATVAVTGGALAWKLFGPTISGIAKGASAGVKALAGLGSTGEAALTPLADAQAAAARETALTTGAIEVQQAAIAAGATELEAATLAIEFRTKAEEEMVAADEAAAASSGILAGALGPLGIAVGVLGAAYAAFKLGGGGKLTLQDPSGLLGANRDELLKTAAVLSSSFGDGESGFEKIGRKSLPALKLLRDTVKGAGRDTSDMDTAIKNVTATNERAAAAEAKYGDKVKDTSEKTSKATKEAAYLTAVRNAGISAAVDGASRARDVETAKIAEQGTTEALTQALADEATARRAARGDSDEYRAAEAAISRDKQAEVKASKDVASAERELVDAREASTRSLRDERIENERSALSAERARLSLLDSRDALAKTQDDPRATERQKEQALLDVKDAELSLQEAQNHRGDSAADLAKAERAGVEGSPEVVAAKARVTDAITAQGAAEKQTADDTKAAAKIITDAKKTLVEAEGKTRDAVLAEADAHAAVAEKAFGAAAGQDAYTAALGRMADLIDPRNPFRANLDSFAGTMSDLADLLTIAITGSSPNGLGHTVAVGDVVPGQPLTSHGATHASGKPEKSLSGGIHLHMRNGPTAAEVANELAFGSH